jgi:hypothetical protein
MCLQGLGNVIRHIASYLVLDRTLDGIACQRAHDTAGFHGSWLPGVFMVHDSSVNKWDTSDL